MKKTSSISLLASFATLKSLNDEKKYSNAYQLLSEFIAYIIKEKALYSFSAIQMKNELTTVFGFDVPEAVVKTAINSLKYVSKKNGSFLVETNNMVLNDKFAEIKGLAESNNNSLINKVEAYIKERDPEAEIVLEVLNQDLIAFLVEGNQKPSGKYINLISEFVLKNENDELIQNELRAIREGSVLYIGINYNINETGSLKKPLTLFLGTEVLFSLVGYNGEIYKKLAEDFYAQVRAANANGRKIKLSYFPDVKKEMDDYFNMAESIVDKKGYVMDKPAMKTIVNGCNTIADVRIKQADFYNRLKVSFDIIEDPKQDYYDEKYVLYNLESVEYLSEKEQEGWKYVSNINKLREGQIYKDNTEAEYLLVTNASNILKASKAQAERVKSETNLEFVSDYATSVDRMTNILWYKLGKGFGRKEYPTNVDIVLKARVALASSISHAVSELYTKTVKEYENGEITDEQVASRILTLRKKPILPEELEGDSIEDCMDFSPEFLSRFEEEVESNKIAIKEKDEVINNLRADTLQKIEEKEKKIAQKEQLLLEETEKNKVLSEELDKYRQKEESKKKRIEQAKKVCMFFASILWKVIVIGLLTILVFFIDEKFDLEILKSVVCVFDVIAILFTAWSAITRDFKKYFPKHNVKENC